MKDYLKPEVEVVDFVSEPVADFGVDPSGTSPAPIDF